MLKTRFQIKPKAKSMGEIIANTVVSNSSDNNNKISFDALVDTGATFLTLPGDWKAELGDREVLEEVELELATGAVVTGEICGPVRIKIGEFRPIVGEVLFMEMETGEDGNYEPLIGYLPLEAIPAGVDMLNHRLFKVKAIAKQVF